MQNQNYFRSLEYPETNIADDSKYLLVNCTGLSHINRKFKTYMPNGRQDFYLQYLVSGNLKVWINNESYLMGPGQFIVYYPKTPYSYEIENKEEIVYYWLHFTGYNAYELIKEFNIPNKTIIHIGIKEEIINTFNALYKEFILRDQCFEAAVTSKLLEILVLFNRSILQNDINNVNDNRKIFLSIEYIHKNLGSKIMIKDLARIEHFSISRYRSVFQQCTGVTPIEYIITLRINKACELLNQSDFSIYEIAEFVGYPDQLYFSRIFKKRLGMTPSRYRAVKRNSQN